MNALTANTGAGVIGGSIEKSVNNQMSRMKVLDRSFLPSASLTSEFLVPDIQDNISTAGMKMAVRMVDGSGSEL